MVDVVLPVLDEAGAMETVLRSLPEGYRAIVVDNGSSDGSADIARGLGARVLYEPQRGFGAACFTGLLAARADVVCFMDCDGSLRGEDLPRVVAPLRRGDADLVLGARLGRGTSSWTARLANRALAWVVRRRTGVRLTDLGPMRAGRREQLVALDLRDRRFGWPLEMVLRAHESGLRISEVPVSHQPRIGRSKVTGTLRGSVRTALDMAAVLR